MVAPIGPPPPRRVSYQLPAPSSAVPLLALPPSSASKRGHTAPLYSIRPGTRTTVPHVSPPAHPTHRLPVTALALDLSTSLASSSPSKSSSGQKSSNPGGILYTGGRDGLLCSWELGLPTRKRRRAYGRTAASSDSESGSDGEDDEGAADYSTDALDIQLEGVDSRPLSAAAARKSLAVKGSALKGGRPRAVSSASAMSAASSRRSGKGDPRAKEVAFEHMWEVDQDRLDTMEVPPKAKFRQCIQSHTDWINDIVLCNYNRTLISASSDSLILAWNPHSSNHDEQVVPTRIGRHSDYVRCLAGAREANWVASGGFDRKIKLWDVQEGRSNSVLELPSPPASVYSLSATASGSLIAAGSPERVIRCWDPRTRKQAARLGGHTDNVRAVILSEEGKWLLSASSDTTVKLWSLTAQKCLHTFSHHASSAWSLFSQHPSLSIFYSGDRDGNVCKIDLENTGDPGEGECIVLARDGPDDPVESRRGCEGITQLVAQDDTYVWTAGGSSSVKRWRDVPSRTKRAGGRAALLRPALGPTVEPTESTDSLISRTQSPDLTQQQPDNSFTERDKTGLPTVSFLAGLTTPLSRTTSSPSPRAPTGAAILQNARPSSLRMRASPSPGRRPPPVSHVSSGLNNSTSAPTAPDSLFEIPFDALVPLTSPDDTYFSSAFAPRNREADATTIYSSMSVLSVPAIGSLSASARGPMAHSSSSFGRSPPPEGAPLDGTEPLLGANLSERDYFEREAAGEATPLRSEPDDVILGTQGLSRCELLNDRRHALTFAAEDDHHPQSVALWDIVTGQCIGEFAPDELTPQARKGLAPADSLSTSSGTGSNSTSADAVDILDYVKERIEGEASVTTWCKTDCRVGALTVHLEEARVWDAEIYADEAELKGVDVEREFPPDHRINFGKWVLRQVFDGFVEAELELRAGGGTPVPSKALALGDAPPRLGMGAPTPGRKAPGFISLQDLPAHQHPSAAATPGTKGSKTPGMTIGLATPALKKAVLPEIPKDLAYEDAPRGQLWNSTSSTTNADAPPKPHGTPFGLGMTSLPGSPGGRTPTASNGWQGGDYFSLPAPNNPDAQSAKAQDAPARASPAQTPAVTPGVPGGVTPGGTLMGRLGRFGLGKSSKKTADPIAPLASIEIKQEEAPAANEDGRTVEEVQQHRILEQVLSHPVTPAGQVDAPRVSYRSDMAIIISEETKDGSAWQVTYRGLVGTGHEDLAVLEQKAPLWLLDYLLGNRVVVKEPPKISFIVQPWRDPQQAGLPELPNANVRLTANRSLRIKKVTHYVADKLDLRRISRSRAPSIHHAAPPGGLTASTPANAPETAAAAPYQVPPGAEGDDYNPEEELEILCGDTLMPLGATLGTVRAYYWRAGAPDVVLQYRVKGIAAAGAQ